MIVGSGVIVMIGISFVPVLICIFMIAAAIYDYWAVHRSKHMLELADTMIDLKLPVVLVAPKDANYSFRSEQGSMRDSESITDSSAVQHDDGEVSKKGRDALFMGLGDVIFPGMLVISSLTYMPELGGEVYNPYGSMYLSQILVALGTLVGGLFGYAALMRFVAKGNAQPGLPLLNGGAILGYIVTGIIVVGPAALWQDITFL
jgi:presenilin-like A22 family membrane protease